MIPLEQGGCCLARYNASSAPLPSKRDHILSRYRPIAPRPIAPRPIAPKPEPAASPSASDLQSSSSMSVGSKAGAGPAASASADTTSSRGRRSRKRSADRCPAGRGSSKRSAPVQSPAKPVHHQGGFLTRFGLAAPDMSCMSMSMSADAERSTGCPGLAEQQVQVQVQQGQQVQQQQQQHQHQLQTHGVGGVGGMGMSRVLSDFGEASVSSALTLSSGAEPGGGSGKRLAFEDAYAKMAVSPYSGSVSGSIFHQERAGSSCTNVSHFSSPVPGGGAAGGGAGGGCSGGPGTVVDRDAAFMERAAAASAPSVNKLLHKVRTNSGGFTEMLKGITGYSLDHGSKCGGGGDVGSSSGPGPGPGPGRMMALDLNSSSHVASGMRPDGTVSSPARSPGRGSGSSAAALDLNRAARDVRGCSLDFAKGGFRSVRPLVVQDNCDAAAEADCSRPQLVTLSLLPDTPSHVKSGSGCVSACTSVGLSLSSSDAADVFRQDAGPGTGAGPCRDVYGGGSGSGSGSGRGRCLEDRFQRLRSRQLERESLMRQHQHGLGHGLGHGEGEALEAKPLQDHFRELVSRASIAGGPRCGVGVGGGGAGSGVGEPLIQLCADRSTDIAHIDLAYLEQVYSTSCDPVMLTDENQVVLWYNSAFKRASAERSSNRQGALSPYIDPLGVPTRLSSCMFQASPQTKCRAVLWGFLKKFVTQEAAPVPPPPEDMGMQERNFFGLGPAVFAAAGDDGGHKECGHKVIAPQPVRAVGSLGNSTTLSRLLAAVRPSPE